MRDCHDQEIQRTVGKIKHTILEYRMLPEDGRIVIGVSGGADSMALAHFLSGLIHNKERILIAHINHGLRGTEALRDEQHVEAWCRENGLCFVVFHADVRQMSADTGKGEEECGREIRYSFFESLIKEENDRIATAHTRSDACETLLFHLAIGAGARGMAGIPPVRGRIIRPFIDITRKEVEQYCDYFRIPYVTDSSNASENYARNRLRIGIRPIFDTINPSWEQAIGRLMRSFMEDESCLVHYAKEALADAKMADGYSLNALSSLPQAASKLSATNLPSRSTL